MKKTNAYSSARTRRRPADWWSRSIGTPDEIARAVVSRAGGCMRVTCSFMSRLPPWCGRLPSLFPRLAEYPLREIEPLLGFCELVSEVLDTTLDFLEPRGDVGRC